MRPGALGLTAAIVGAAALLAVLGAAGGDGQPLLAVACLALVVFAAMRLYRRAGLLEAAAEARARRMMRLANASERLLRLRDPSQVAASAERQVAELLGATAHVTLGRATEPDPPALQAAERQSAPLLAVDGSRLGRITVSRPSGPSFSSEDELVFDQLSRVAAAALEGAALLEQAVRAKSEVELILGTISDGMVVLAQDWRLRYVNSAALGYLHRAREDMLGAVFWDIFPDARDSEFGERLEAAMRGGEDVAFATFFPPLGAWFETRCYPFASGMTVYFRDATAQHETEERLRQAQRLESLGQLTGGIAHDINNLLTVMLGNFEMLALTAEQRGASGAEDQELAEAGLRAGESASQLMHRLLAFSRRQPLSPQVVDVGALLASLEPLLRRSVGETVDLRIEAPPDLWPALIDPAELENAILNLAINARDAMPAGGRLSIAAANAAVDRVYAATAGLDRTGEFVMVSVADTGAGMTPDVRQRAFDPFFTTKQPGRGTGLGLSMVHGFANQSGGHVVLDSEPGQGTVLRLYLPRTGGQPAAPLESAARGAPGGRELVLLVEDSELVRAHIAAMLRGLGYTVHAAADGAEALLMLREGLRPDLLLTDVVLPAGMTGPQVADAAAELVPELRVLFTSGYAGSVLLRGGRVMPGVELLGKPFRRSELAARLRAQLAADPWRPGALFPSRPAEYARRSEEEGEGQS